MARIAIILGRLVIGGTTTDTLRVAQQLQYRHDLLLITGGGQRDEFEAAYLTSHLPRVRHVRIQGFSASLHPLQDLMAIRQIRQILQRFQPQIVHTHSAKAGLLGRLAARSLPGVHLMHTYHGMMFSGYYGPLKSKLICQTERWLAGITHTIITLSESQRKDLTDRYVIAPPEKVRVVPLGIDVALFQTNQADKRRLFRERYMLEPGTIAIGIIGRLALIKNHPLFLETAALLLRDFPDLRLFIIGDGQLRRRYEEQCERLGLSHTYFPEAPAIAQVTFTSWITEIDLAMGGLDLVMLTSINEGTPVSLMEAQAAGRPVVTTAAGGITDIVADGVTGFVVKKHTATALAEACRKLLIQPGLGASMGHQGAAWALEHFQREKQLEILNKLYDLAGQS